jgi:hypothetical protein
MSLNPGDGRKRRRKGGIAPTPPIDHPAPVFVYSTFNDRSSPLPLSGATLSGTVYIFCSNTNVELIRLSFFVNPADPDNLPTEANELTDPSFVRADVAAPWDLRGGNATTATGWDTATDPARIAARAPLLIDGARTIAVRARYSDGVEINYSVDFEVDNVNDGVAPGTPNLITVTTPADGHAAMDWSDASDAPTAYAVRHSINADMSASSAPINVTPFASQFTITGLAAGLRYFQVRASNAFGTSAWSNIRNATITGGGVIPPTPRLINGTHYAVGGDDAFIRWGYTQGSTMRKTTTANGGQYTTARQWVRSNHDRTKPTTLGAMGHNAINDAIEMYNNTVADGYLRPIQTFGPRVFLTMHLSMGPIVSAKASSAGSFLQTAEIVRGDWDAQFDRLFQDILQCPKDGPGTIVSPQNPRGYWATGRVTVLSNEANAPWYSDWNGIDPNLVAAQELCDATLTWKSVTGGTFRITFRGQQTDPIAWNANNATILAALNDLDNVVPGDIVVCGGPLPARVGFVCTADGQYGTVTSSWTVQSSLTPIANNYTLTTTPNYSATNATNWGANNVWKMLKAAAVTGNRGPLWLAAFRRMAARRDDVGAGTIPLGINLASPGSGTGGTTTLNPDAFAPPSEGLYDVLGGNCYVRSEQRPRLRPGTTLPATNPAAWDFDFYKQTINEMIAWGITFNRPFEMLEWGGTYDASWGHDFEFSFKAKTVNNVPRPAASGGTFRITFQGAQTGPLAWNANAATVLAAMNLLGNVDPGDIEVLGGPLPDNTMTIRCSKSPGRYATTTNVAVSLQSSLTPAGVDGVSPTIVNIPNYNAGMDVIPQGDQGLAHAWQWLWDRIAGNIPGLPAVSVSHLGFFCINSASETKGAVYRLTYDSIVEGRYPISNAALHDYFGFI